MLGGLDLSSLQKSSLSRGRVGIGGGSVGRAVASDTRDPRFKSQHRQNSSTNGNQIETTKIKKKLPGMAHQKNSGGWILKN